MQSGCADYVGLCLFSSSEKPKALIQRATAHRRGLGVGRCGAKRGLKCARWGAGGCVGGVCVSLPLLGKECVPAGLLAWDEDGVRAMEQSHSSQPTNV